VTQTEFLLINEKAVPSTRKKEGWGKERGEEKKKEKSVFIASPLLSLF